MHITLKTIFTVCKVWLITCVVCQIIVSCLKSFSEPGIGAFTNQATTNYGKIREKCTLTGPAYGNENMMYVQGTSNFEGKAFPAYLVVKLKNGRVESWGSPQRGETPGTITHEYPELTDSLEKMHANYSKGDRNPKMLWVRPRPFSSGWTRDLSYHIVKQIDINKEVSLLCSKEYRSISARISFPFIYMGALVLDFITAPLQFVFIILFFILFPGFSQT